MALRRLDKEHDYKVAHDSTDIRGWKVKDASGQHVGKIDGLLFEPTDNEVRYAIAEIDNRCVLLPVGMIDLDDRDHEVLARGYSKERLLTLREYREADFNETEEREHYMAHVPEHKEKQLDYKREHFRGKMPERIRLMEEKLKIGKRDVQTGEVVAQKRPVTETVREDVTLRQEKVDIERHPVNREVRPGETISQTGDTIRVPIYGEELVTEKRPVIKEEIEIRKRPETVTEHVEETVRREELEFAGTEPTEADIRRRETLNKNPLDKGTLGKERVDVYQEDPNKL